MYLKGLIYSPALFYVDTAVYYCFYKSEVYCQHNVFISTPDREGANSYYIGLYYRRAAEVRDRGYPCMPVRVYVYSIRSLMYYRN